MIRNGTKVPFKFNFGAPSCVPATSFETSGAEIGTDDVEELLKMSEVRYLSEMMNFPGVLHNDPAVMKKLELACLLGKPVDGHAPGLVGKELEKYIGAGITTDHECVTLEEAMMKAGMGMKILIREGSAAKNFEALSPMIATHPGMVMFCSDDKHPDDLANGHINRMVARALSEGFDPVDVLRCCTLNPVIHYKLDSGLLQSGDPADIVVVDSLESFGVLSVYVDGILVACEGRSLIAPVPEEPLNRFSAAPVTPADLVIPAKPSEMRVIRAFDGQLFTESVLVSPLVRNGAVIPDTARDILKLAVVNRYHPAPPAAAFITGFGLKRGAIASCVAHDSHNIVAVGADDESIARAVNLVIEGRGGIALVDGKTEMILTLPFAGIMSGADGGEVALQYGSLDRRVREMGTSLRSPYMTLSFMALLVIPELKLSDRGLFDATAFSFTPLFPGSL